MDNTELKALFQRYLDKKASPDDVRQLLHYFSLDQESKLLQELITEEMQSPLDEPQLADIKEGAVYSRVDKALQARIDREEQRSVKYRYRYRAAIAAAAVLLVVSGWLVWSDLNHARTATVFASYGKQEKVTLPDHSTVMLNSGATLSYPENFGGKERDVFLKNGEAYFQVLHNVNKPFVIQAGEATVTVLGTSFEISTLNKEIRVSVTTGKVGINLKGKASAIYLVAGQRAIISKTTHQVAVSTVPVTDVAAWRQERLLFDDQPLAEVMQRLEQKYNVQIKIENPDLLSERVTMRLGNQPLADVLTAISFANHFNYTKVSNQLIIVK